MTLRLLRLPVGEANWEDVSHELVEMSGMERRHNEDYSPIAPDVDMSFAGIEPQVGDRFRFELDGTDIMLFEAETVTRDRETELWEVEAVDPLGTLADWHVGAITYTWLDGKQHTMNEYKRMGYTYSYFDEMYITLPCLLDLLIMDATGIHFDRAYAMDDDSGYTYNNNGTITPLIRSRLALNLKQLISLGVSDPDAEWYDTSTCFDLLQWICRALRCGIVYHDGVYRLQPVNAGYTALDPNDIYSLSSDALTQYDAVVAKRTMVDPADMYAGAWDDTTNESASSPEYEEPADTKSVSLPANFELFYRDAYSYRIRALSFNDHTSFLQQLADLLAADYTATRGVDDIETSWNYYDPSKFAWKTKLAPSGCSMTVRQLQQEW